MRLSEHRSETEGTARILGAQLRDTMCLQTCVDDCQQEWGNNARVADLLNAIRLELQAITKLVELRAVQSGITKDIRCSSTDSELKATDGEGLESLVILFCKYGRVRVEPFREAIKIR